MRKLQVALATLTSLLLGCAGETGDLADPTGHRPAMLDGGSSPINTGLTPCTDAATCCASSLLECLVDLEKQSLCKCYRLWTCDQALKGCSQDLPVPQKGSGWKCTWAAEKYTCTGTSSGAPGAGAWKCVSTGVDQWTCERPTPNPTNVPEGVAEWSCVVEGSQLRCTKHEVTPVPPGTPGECKAGSQTFTTPGPVSFTVPSHATLTVEVWGGGGGGQAYGESNKATAGGDSSFDGALVAGGGAAATGAGGAGGKATGGTANTPGGNGGAGCQSGFPVLCGSAAGGAAPKGGAGGPGPASVDACGGGDGQNGQAPGGGGAGTWTCQGTWWTGTGWGQGGGGGGAGAYASKTFAKGELAPGGAVPLVVGAGGLGSKGAMTAGFPGAGRNPGSYTGGDGGAGQVKISWTCP